MRPGALFCFVLVVGCAGPKGTVGGGDAPDLVSAAAPDAAVPPDLSAAPDLRAPVDSAVAARPDSAVAPPSLLALDPATTTIAVGQTFTLTATFDGKYLGAGTLTVPVASSAPGIALPQANGQLAFNADSAKITCAALRVGDATFTATVGNLARSAAVHVVPSVQSVAPASPRVLKGMSATLTVTLSSAALQGGAAIALASADPKIVGLALPGVQIPAGAASATFTVNAVGQGGPVAVTASYAGSTQAAQVAAIEPVPRLSLSEVLYDARGADPGFEWVEIWNGGNAPVDLSGYFLGAVTSSMTPAYQAVTPALSGTLMPGDCKVVGGPMADPAANGLMVGYAYFDALQFNPTLPNGDAVPNSSTAVGLFQGAADKIGAATLVDAVIYGVASRGIKDETAGTMRVDVGYIPFPNQTLERVGVSSWRVQAQPSGGNCDWLHP